MTAERDAVPKFHVHVMNDIAITSKMRPDHRFGNYMRVPVCRRNHCPVEAHFT
jgi:hypothetical protein